ncbi:MAG: molybdopterin-dependent oxidoreductase [Pseudomonadota bacterium]
MDGSDLPSRRSTCPYCGVGCGVVLTPDGAGGLLVKGDAQHPANHGKLCSKGSALGDTVGEVVNRGYRLRGPVMRGRDVSWDVALQEVADRFKQTMETHGPEACAFYVSGQLLTEDYYVANKLIKGFIGTANIDTNSRLCMASTVAGHKRAFGTDTVPGTYEDLDGADLIVLVGSNLAWCHPILMQRVLAAQKERGTRIIVVDPRRTASCASAEMHLKIEAGSDVALFNYLLSEIAARGALSADYAAHVTGLEAALASAQADEPSVTGLTEAELKAFADAWIGTSRVVTVFSQGVNQSTSGADKVNAILNCHLATGRIGLPGCGPLSVTGQPNAMGGREVGGLANMLACHLDLENAEHREAVQTFWDAPQMPQAAGLKAVDMFRAVGDGRIKALWIIHTNPAVSMPEADAVRDAIAGCDFVVVSDVTGATDTARLAHVLLPASAWAEKDGTVTNSDRTISRQRKVLPDYAGARPDWAALAEVGRRMGWQDAFDYAGPAEIFREHAALSGIAGRLGKDFDISGLAGLSDAEYDALTPQRWPVTAARQGGRFFADGQFFHADGKGKLLPVSWRAPVEKRSPRYPFRFNTGRVRDQWHTMTRTALSPKLSSHLAEPYLDMHPEDASAQGLQAADLVEVKSPAGQAILRLRITDDVTRGQVFAPMHWTGETAPSGRIDALVAGHVDPVSGQPESKASVVAVQKMQAAWYGFAVSQEAPRPDSAYWARARTQSGYRLELAGRETPQDWEAAARRLFGLDVQEAAVTSFTDASRGTARLAFHSGGILRAALFVAREPVAVMRDYLATRPGQSAAGALIGRAPADVPDPGPTVCSCFNVGLNTIARAVEEQQLMDVDAVGRALRAGTNCGSCKPEIAALLASIHVPKAAQ